MSPGRWRLDVHFKERHNDHRLRGFPSNQMAAEKRSLEDKIQSCKTQLSLATRRSVTAQVGVVSWFFSLILDVGEDASLSSLFYLSGSYFEVLPGPGLGLWRREGVNYSATTLQKGQHFTCWPVRCFMHACFQRWALYLTKSLFQNPKPGPGNST